MMLRFCANLSYVSNRRLPSRAMWQVRHDWLTTPRYSEFSGDPVQPETGVVKSGVELTPGYQVLMISVIDGAGLVERTMRFSALKSSSEPSPVGTVGGKSWPPGGYLNVAKSNSRKLDPRLTSAFV